MLRRITFVMALSLLGWTAQRSAADPPPVCAVCIAWNAPQMPFHIYGNTYYVGVHGLSSLLIDSGKGLVLIDGDLPQSPPQIKASIKALGFDPGDIKLILNSHAHFDHAGGINELERLTGAPVLASEWSAKVLRAGGNVLLLDEPTNDLDIETLRALEDALLNFPGCAVVISHDRWFLDRIASHILAFEGNSEVVWFEGNYQDYVEDLRRRRGDDAAQPHRLKYRKLTR